MSEASARRMANEGGAPASATPFWTIGRPQCQSKRLTPRWVAGAIVAGHGRRRDVGSLQEAWNAAPITTVSGIGGGPEAGAETSRVALVERHAAVDDQGAGLGADEAKG